MTVARRGSLDARLGALAPLAEPLRRRLYLFVSERSRAVGRDEASAALGISRSLAAFHLDRLVEDGLLVPEFERLTGRTGPGAGRPAKLYRRSPEQHDIHLPDRNYELAARLFADALDAPATADPLDVVHAEARSYGRGLGEQMRATNDADDADDGATAKPGDLGELAPDGAVGSGALPGSERRLVGALAEEGFEPLVDSGVVRLGNCPFQALVADHRDLTCGMNLSLMTGLLEGLDAPDWQAIPDPRPNLCCVAFTPIPPDSPPGSVGSDHS